MIFSSRAFVDEMSKIAKKKSDQAIYSPGVVAHEAGHAWLHRQPTGPNEKAKTDVMGLARNFGPLATGGAYAAYRVAKGKSPFRPGLVYSVAAGTAPMLVDEFGSSIRGHHEIKKGKVKKFTKKELAQERNRLIGAGASYAAAPLELVALGRYGRTPGRALAVKAGATAVRLGSLSVATKEKGPRITASEAKKLVQDIAPGTEVYVTKESVPMGSAYLRAPSTRIGKALANVQLKAFMKKKDRKRIIERGGVLLAPMNKKVITKAFMGDNTLDEADKFKRLK